MIHQDPQQEALIRIKNSPTELRRYQNPGRRRGEGETDPSPLGQNITTRPPITHVAGMHGAP